MAWFSVKKYRHFTFFLLVTLQTLQPLPSIRQDKRQSCPCALTEHHSMKAYWGSGGIHPHILDLGTRQMSQTITICSSNGNFLSQKTFFTVHASWPDPVKTLVS